MPNKYIERLSGMIVDIAGILFTVVTEEDMIERFGMQGQIDFRNNQIIIDPEMGNRDTLTVLIHEVVEGIIRRYQIQIPHETIVFLECSLFTVLMDNPKMLEVLLEEAKGGKERVEEQIAGEDALKKILEGVEDAVCDT